MHTPQHARTGTLTPARTRTPRPPRTPAGAHVRRLVFVFVLFWFWIFVMGTVYVVVLSFFFNGRDRCDEKKSKKLTGSSPRTHEVSALKASPNRICRYVRPSPDPRTTHVAIGSSVPGQGRRSGAEILPFRNASGRFLSQRGCVVQHCQLRQN